MDQSRLLSHLDGNPWRSLEVVALRSLFWRGRCEGEGWRSEAVGGLHLHTGDRAGAELLRLGPRGAEADHLLLQAGNIVEGLVQDGLEGDVSGVLRVGLIFVFSEREAHIRVNISADPAVKHILASSRVRLDLAELGDLGGLPADDLVLGAQEGQGDVVVSGPVQLLLRFPALTSVSPEKQ